MAIKLPSTNLEQFSIARNISGVNCRKLAKNQSLVLHNFTKIDHR